MSADERLRRAGDDVLHAWHHLMEASSRAHGTAPDDPAAYTRAFEAMNRALHELKHAVDPAWRCGGEDRAPVLH